ncbi:MAG: D-glycero-beta-D-manno-heptose 1-phosphate adenylyltransferase [Deltaproteobacteria bacterium]|nr:D-glycero-beta-D-manno-heptose 1-phosphate adenylyltransferase [Deltaproteobacteria bacterium]
MFSPEKIEPMAKIYPSAANLQRELMVLRRQEKKVVFTNGCFDLLHPGHIYTLTHAKALGEVLVVGINSDASVKRLKGEKRPILNELERATVLAALEAVDYVITFEEDTPLQLIRALQPDILVKGGDWSAEAVVGKEEVEARGGQVVLIPYQTGASTTGIIERVLAAYAERR